MSITFKCTARRMAGGQGHEHISKLWWVKVVAVQVTTTTGESTREAMAEFIEKNGSEKVWLPDRDPNKKGAWVHVHNNARINYLQTVADGRKTVNLRALPEQ